MAQKSPDGSVLLVIDMQHDFVDNPTSPVLVPGASNIILAVAHVVELARLAKVPVIWIVREHDSSGIDVELFRKHMYGNPDAPGPLIAGSEGAALVNDLKPAPGELKIVKKRFSAFHQTNLCSILHRMECTHVVICGVQTPNCIRATAYDAVSLDFDVTVLPFSTASATKEINDSNLRDLRNIGVHTPCLESTSGDLMKWLEPLRHLQLPPDSHDSN